MNLRTTIILLIVFAALGSYYFFVERGKPSEQERERLEMTAVRFDRFEIESMELAYAGEEIRCEKGESDSDWDMLKPVEAKADESAIASLLATMSSLEATRFLPADTTALEQYGLAEPSIRVSVASSSPPDSHWVLVGDETPTGDAYYAFADTRDRIALIPSSTVDLNFKREAFDLRDKTVVEFEVAQVTGLEISYDDVKIRCDRLKRGPWMLTEPVRTRGDNTEINAVLWDLENAKVREFVDGELEDLSVYGLHNPAATVKVFVGASRSLRRLDFGEETEEGGLVYARRGTYSGVVKVDKTLLDKVKKEFHDLRRKQLLEFDTSDVASIEIAMGDSVFSCLRDTVGDWTAAIPDSTPLKKWKMNGVSSQLSFARAFSFIDDPDPDLRRMGLTEPQMTVTVTLRDSSATGLEFGAVEGDEVFVRAEGQIARISHDFLKDMIELVRDPPYVEEEEVNEQPG